MAGIRSLSWRQFESYIGDLFRTEGYFVMETPEGPDYGVDLVLRKMAKKLRFNANTGKRTRWA